jgi:hypothetical protein
MRTRHELISEKLIKVRPDVELIRLGEQFGLFEVDLYSNGRLLEFNSSGDVTQAVFPPQASRCAERASLAFSSPCIGEAKWGFWLSA